MTSDYSQGQPPFDPNSNPENPQRQVGTDAAQLVETAKQDLGAIRDEVTEQAQGLAEEVKAQVGEATDKAKSIAADQKDYIAQQLTDVANAVSKVADELGGNKTPTAGYVRTLANGLQDFSKTVGERDVDSLLGLAEDFGRKQPAAFMGAAALAGFVASRFLMASGQRRSSAPAPAAGQSGTTPAGPNPTSGGM